MVFFSPNHKNGFFLFGSLHKMAIFLFFMVNILLLGLQPVTSCLILTLKPNQWIKFLHKATKKIKVVFMKNLVNTKLSVTFLCSVKCVEAKLFCLMYIVLMIFMNSTMLYMIFCLATN